MAYTLFQNCSYYTEYQYLTTTIQYIYTFMYIMILWGSHVHHEEHMMMYKNIFKTQFLYDCCQRTVADFKYY